MRSANPAICKGSAEALDVAQLTLNGRDHVVKYMEAFVFGQELAAYWGEEGAYETPEDESPGGWAAFFAAKRGAAEAASKRANAEKMAGFYVDLRARGREVSSPADIEAGRIADDLQTAAQVIEMSLIIDHSRMKFDAETSYDGTHIQQNRLLPISHPEDWAAARAGLKNRD